MFESYTSLLQTNCVTVSKRRKEEEEKRAYRHTIILVVCGKQHHRNNCQPYWPKICLFQSLEEKFRFVLFQFFRLPSKEHLTFDTT